MFCTYISKIFLISFENEKKSNLIIDTNSSKIDLDDTRYIEMSIQSTYKN